MEGNKNFPVTWYMLEKGIYITLKYNYVLVNKHDKEGKIEGLNKEKERNRPGVGEGGEERGKKTNK